MMNIGQYHLMNNVLAAPMAGVSDAVFRKLALQFGADMAVAEMVSSNPLMRGLEKTTRRLQCLDQGIRAVQIVGHDPDAMAAAAKFNVDQGAQIIDINMGCPAKKVCNKLAGSALLAEPDQVRRILNAVVDAVEVPVTLKIRTGPNADDRNGVAIAELAQHCGVQSLVVHGRTRACRFKGNAEYDTIRQIKQAVSIPVIANGDINTPQKARQVLAHTGADAVMIGRAARGKPWLYQQVVSYLQTGTIVAPPSTLEIGELLLTILEQMYSLYGEYSGVRIARKHLNWYTRPIAGSEVFRKQVNLVETSVEQFKMTREFFQEYGLQLKTAA